MANSFWRYIVLECISKDISWERMIKAFPELEDEVVHDYYNEQKSNKQKPK